MKYLNKVNKAVRKNKVALGVAVFGISMLTLVGVQDARCVKLEKQVNKLEIQNSDLKETNAELSSSKAKVSVEGFKAETYLQQEYYETEDEYIEEEYVEATEDEGGYGYDLGEFVITFYDISTDGSEWGNITANGFDLNGHSLESARAIAVDPNVIPLGSKVYISFAAGYEFLDGMYTAVDTGGAIQGNRIDVFAEGYNINSLGLTTASVSMAN